VQHTELDVLRERLQQRLDELTRRAGKIEHDLRQPLSPDSEERVTEMENDEVLEGLDASVLDEARQIQEALGRVNAGTYGICLTCGNPVGEKRLEAVPHAATCVNCAS
jgi:RNA polymerase-binding transcription factor DksA